MADQPDATQSAVIARDVRQHQPGVWTESDVALLHRTLAPDLNRDEFLLFGRLCRLRQLDPFAGDVFPIVYSKNKPDKRKMVLIQSIDAMRKRGLETGELTGTSGPEWCGPDGQWVDVWLKDEHPEAARYGMSREGMHDLGWHVVRWKDVAKDTTKPEGQFWNDMDAHMLGLAAERQAWRKTLPGSLGGLYGPEEVAPTGLMRDGTAVESVAELIDERSDAFNDETGGTIEGEEVSPPPSDEPGPERDATEGPPDDPEYNMQDVFRALWTRMQAATPSWEWKHLANITGWPEGADREAGVRVLLAGAIGSEDELAGMIFDALQATRSS